LLGFSRKPRSQSMNCCRWILTARRLSRSRDISTQRRINSGKSPRIWRQQSAILRT